MGFNRVQVDLFYSLFWKELENHKFTASTIFSLDETGISTVPNRLPKVVSIKGKRSVNKIVSGESGQTITAVCRFSTSGVYVPPAFIFPRKQMRNELLDGASGGSVGFVSDSVFIIKMYSCITYSTSLKMLDLQCLHQCRWCLITTPHTYHCLQ